MRRPRHGRRAVDDRRREQLGAREDEAGRHDAHHRRGHSVELDGPSDHRRIGREPPAPEPVAQHRDGGPARPRLVGGEEPAARGSDPEHPGEVVGDEQRRQPLGVARPAQRAPRGAVARDRAERGQTLDIEQLGLREHGVRQVQAEIDVEHGHQPVRLGERQRAEQHAVDHREDRAVGADAEGQREHDGKGEAGGAPEAPRREAEVLAQAQPPLAPAKPGVPPAGDGAAAPAGRVDVAQAAAGFLARPLRRHAGGDVLLGAHLEMEGQLVVDLVARRAPPEPHVPPPSLGRPAHADSSAACSTLRTASA